MGLTVFFFSKKKICLACFGGGGKQNARILIDPRSLVILDVIILRITVNFVIFKQIKFQSVVGQFFSYSTIMCTPIFPLVEEIVSTYFPDVTVLGIVKFVWCFPLFW